MFVDEAEIYVRSGKGGDGMMHFHREKFVARGGPDGGDGGHGGDVIMRVDRRLNTLGSYRHVRKYIASDGENGGKNNMTGRTALPKILPVPPGTIVRDADTDELLGDLIKDGQELVVATGAAIRISFPRRIRFRGRRSAARPAKSGV